MSNTTVDRSLSASALVLLVLWSVPLVGAPPIEATVCGILQKPSAFNGKLVHVKGTLKSGFENLSLSEGGCGAIWVDFADDPNVSPRPKFKLVRDAKFDEFERLVNASSSAEVTLLGRLDGVDEVKTRTHVTHQQEGKDGTVSAIVGQESTGFGHMGQYTGRLVLAQVFTVGPTLILPALIPTPPTQ